MHLIMWIENAFKFCGKLIHFYKERSRHFHISVETTFSYQCGNKFIIRAHFSTYIYASFIIVNPITVDSIIFVGINFRKLKKKWHVLKCARIINLFPHWYENVVSTLIWKCLDRLYWFFIYLWCFNATFSNI
jgi:hypothetical protein